MAKDLALFIDCDRIDAAFMSVIFDYLQNHGYNICIKKAYVGKDNVDIWYNQLERQYCNVILGNTQANINMKISVDVAKALYQGRYHAIAIASNYKEFGVLASSIRMHGVEALCFYQASKGNEIFLKRAYNIIYDLEPTQSKTHVGSEIESAHDTLEAFESALEGLDMKLLEANLSNDTTTSKQSRSQKVAQDTKAKKSTKSSTTKK
ncbi:hypothetical protein CQA53_00890 [Helicobacter didelphidarum]|uniref:NYN domain-containing protein n=1 Tax=Helicobacter didelphidarum TaxID=2040648 RepID=A0A3D8IRN5_9HELI|nr:NYN domain-containing protein [Helicobacter didelphidarum]RDU67596.1 hypothetical protein CQA53_00890 [Helicobacter didelphidarum]